ncbi:hypothetical protein PR001_g24872 [Phytophthora rubi]|uniref:Uncharacterized protein n=1 Tax=Phytophthora rubi TaxID=129364 RepID=A0A6A3L7Z9_9STRA|nr:hypothetical protein PR001_g24872 [Phytophthora rubi]KAE9015682.1 hypothetical protein PR002_g13864 [Phytophthora rubi]
MDDTCQLVFSLSNNSLELAEYQIRILSRDGHYKALKWFIDRGMTWDYHLVFEFESSVIDGCEPVVQLLLGVIACPCFRYRLLDQLDMIRSSERRNLVEEYATAPDIVDKLCAVIVNMSGFALMENVLKSFHERTPPSPIVPEIEKALAMQAARSDNLEFVRFAYRVLSSTICGEVLRPECTAHGNEEILSWLERHSHEPSA